MALNGWFGEMFVEGVGDLAFSSFSKTSADLFIYLFYFIFCGCLCEMFESL
jgi:hypothetical protein